MLTENTPHHTYNMRPRLPAPVNRSNKRSSEKILRYYLPNFIKTIPEHIKSSIYTHSLQSTKYKYKSFVLANYQPVCSIPNCYVCN